MIVDWFIWYRGGFPAGSVIAESGSVGALPLKFGPFGGNKAKEADKQMLKTDIFPDLLGPKITPPVFELFENFFFTRLSCEC